jgi:hypothetical protein
MVRPRFTGPGKIGPKDNYVPRSSTRWPNQSTDLRTRFAALHILGALMRRQLRPIVLAVSLVAAAGFARADGYEAPRAAAAPVMLQVSNWTGFYANGGVGYGLWDALTTTVFPSGACAACGKTDHGGRGWLGEVGLGYDAQVSDKIVIGALFNYDFSGIKGQLDDGGGAVGKSDNDSTWVGSGAAKCAIPTTARMRSQRRLMARRS